MTDLTNMGQLDYSGTTGIVVKNNDVYITGYISSPLRAVYWKNGIMTILPSNGLSSEATAITIEGNDVYIAGYLSTATFKSVAVYWKNGIMTTLPGTLSGYDFPKAIAVKETDVYLAGISEERKVDHFTDVSAIYWKNGVLKTLRSASSANSIAIVGDDVYIGGATSNTGFDRLAAFWKNDAMTIPVNQTKSEIIAVAAVPGDDVYFALAINPNAAYFKLKNPTIVKTSQTISSVSAIAVVKKQ